MILRRKSWLWWLTFPFAHANYTTIGDTIYYPAAGPPDDATFAHERCHSKQQKAEGMAKFLFLYLLCLPILWNPWRRKWEYEAYQYGQGYDDETIRAILASASYGWLIF